MPREIYELSDESRKVLSDDVKGVADELGKSPQHIYNILNGDTNDPFALFLPIYSAVVRAKGKAHIYRNRLDEVDARYNESTPAKNETECITDKIRNHAKTIETMVSALSDGQLDEREIRAILNDLEIEQKTLDYLRTSLIFKLGGMTKEPKLKAV